MGDKHGCFYLLHLASQDTKFKAPTDAGFSILYIFYYRIQWQEMRLKQAHDIPE